MSAVTQATKDIEATISVDVWNRQKRWEMKKEALLAVAKALSEVDEALLVYTAIYISPDQENPAWQVQLTKRHEQLTKARAGLDEARMLTTFVCGEEIDLALTEFSKAINNIVYKAPTNRTIYGDSQPILTKTLVEIRGAIRKELGVL